MMGVDAKDAVRAMVEAAYVYAAKVRDKAGVTPWFLGATDAPVREGRYQVRFCLGWREVFCEWRRGAWWVGGGGLDKPARVNLRHWPGFHWRGRLEQRP